MNNAQKNPAVMQRLEHFGLGPEQFQTGIALVNAVLEAQKVRQQRDSERWALSQQIGASRETTYVQSKEHIITRAAYRHDPPLLCKLAIGRIAAKRWEWVRPALHLYQEFTARKLNLRSLGVLPQDIAQNQAALEQLLRLREERLAQKGFAEQSTVEHRRTQQALRDWLIDLRAIARTAFRRDPPMPEMFGIVVRSLVTGKPALWPPPTSLPLTVSS